MTGDRSETDEVLIEVALPEELLAEVDRYARGRGTTRSAVVAAALSE
jgi:metal-responsive CopG/Arc/MetJ family transcriptional regulator